MTQGGSRHKAGGPGRDRDDPKGRSRFAAWLRPESVRRSLQVALGLVAGFILGTMAVQDWLAGREATREARDAVRSALNQSAVPLNLFFSETGARLIALEAVAEGAPGNAVRLEPGYRRYGMSGAEAGGEANSAVAAAAARASETGRVALSMPFDRAGLWYAALVKERRDGGGTLVGYEGLQFPVSRIQDWLDEIRLPSGSSVTLLTADGRIWLRVPFAPALMGAAAANDPFAAVVKVDPAQLSRLVQVETEGIDAVVGWRSLESYGLVVAAGVDRAQVEAGMAGAATAPLLIALVVTAGAFVLVTFMGRLQQVEPVRSRPAPPVPAPVPAAAPAPQSVNAGRRLLAVAENMPVVVFEQHVGPGGVVAYDYVSPGLRDVHGIEPARLQANPGILFEMVHPEDRARVKAEYRRAWDSGADLNTVYRIVTPSGEVKWVHNLASAARTEPDHGNLVWDGIVLDVTAQKEAESRLQEVRDEAEISSRVKAEFLANVSHELREPLNAIIGFAEVISQQAYGPVGVEKYVEYAHDINESADHLLAVVNDILDLSKIEAGRATLVLEDTEAGELADSCLRLIHGRAADARLQLRRFVEPALPLLRIDPLKVKQILINLLSNAIKFTRAGGTVTLRVTSTEDSGIAFAVIDTGIGIPEQDLSTAIETYGQVGALSGGREGTGLGLPLAKALTELHGGTLTIESSTGKGTTVTAWFPASCIAPANSDKA